MGKITPTWNITSFRGRNDDGSESAATWIAAADTDFGYAVDTNFRLRLAILETAGGKYTNPDLHFQYRHIEGTNTWTDVTTTSSVVRAFSSGNFTHADNTVQRISSFTFITPNEGMTDTGEVLTTADPESSGIEIEGCFQIRSADVSAGDTIEMRCTLDAAAPDGTPVLPTITAYAPLTVSCNTESLNATPAQGTVTKIVPRVVTCTTEQIEAVFNEILASAQKSYVLDGHTSISDPQSVWLNDANAFDSGLGYEVSYAYTNSIGDGSNNSLSGEGTTAPNDGPFGGSPPITLVEYRIKYETSLEIGQSALWDLKHSGEGLGSFTRTTVTLSPVTTDWLSANAPTGGWTWQKVQDLLMVAKAYTGGA